MIYLSTLLLARNLQRQMIENMYLRPSESEYLGTELQGIAFQKTVTFL
jgi:hypothetical protein